MAPAQTALYPLTSLRPLPLPPLRPTERAGPLKLPRRPIRRPQRTFCQPGALSLSWAPKPGADHSGAAVRHDLGGKGGQMFFVRCPETGGAELAAQYKVGAICCSAGILRTRRPNRCGMTSKAIRTLPASPCSLGPTRRAARWCGPAAIRTSFLSGSPLPRPCSPRAGWT